MEQINTTHNNHHRYLYHFETLSIFAAILLALFGLYDPASSQTGGTTVDPNWANYQTYGGKGGILNVVTAGVDTYNTYNQNVNPANYGAPVSTTGGTGYYMPSTGSNTGGGTTGTSGSIYNYSGINDSDPYRTQGGYGTAKNNSVFNNAGINEAGAVRTQGTIINTGGSSTFTTKGINEETFTATTQENTVSPKHCEFITKYHKFGDRGGDVPKIQQFLKDRGYYRGKIDGVYGITTFKAVRSFQKDYKDKILDPWQFDNKAGSDGTGITNVSTRYAINKMVGCPDPATIVPKTGKILNY